ncbi:hypothetical protein [Frankia sp. EAN1pec]|uniref:hypothetical protein n=1 Tax=Parafrankia sp. (strain EAN1pec) TaxID=298653 RepID=UPI0000541809
MADDLKAGETPTIEQVTEQGQPAVKVTTKSHTLYVANSGPPLPLRQTGTGVDSGLHASAVDRDRRHGGPPPGFSEYNRDQ